MASQITHIVYGKKIFERQKENIIWPEFTVGTTFPDIRYIANIDRSLLHETETKEEMIPKENSFLAGKYVHSLVDEKREDFISKEGVYEILPKVRLTATAVKLVEDEITYPKLQNWKEIAGYFDQVLPYELSFGLGKDIIEKWHQFLKHYISAPPNEKMWEYLILAIGYTPQISEEIIRITRMIKKNEKAMEIIREIYEII
ncbi:hypothetical protein M1545_03035 [Patescibacteria group bacterium]|nr:hypothetical protein [Patescibacteria group bacterium]